MQNKSHTHTQTHTENKKSVSETKTTLIRNIYPYQQIFSKLHNLNNHPGNMASLVNRSFKTICIRFGLIYTFYIKHITFVDIPSQDNCAIPHKQPPTKATDCSSISPSIIAATGFCNDRFRCAKDRFSFKT